MHSGQYEIEAALATAIARSDNIAAIDVVRNVSGLAGPLCRRYFDGDKVLVFADEAGFSAAGSAIIASLRSAGLQVGLHVLPVNPPAKPSVALGDDFAARLEDGTVPVALGSGVINDLVKYAAFQKNTRYFCIATAASMDGYCSGGAPLSDKGFKITIPCRPPKAILADLDVIAAAPPHMTACGYGDLAGKVPAGGDWLIADALGIEPLDDIAWPLVQDNLPEFLADPASLAQGDTEGAARLLAGLNISGLAMEFHGSSRPASGAEHQIAHMWEMEALTFGSLPVAHGACVAVGTTTILALFDWLIGQDLSKLDISAIVGRRVSWPQMQAEIRRRVAITVVADRAIREMASKYLSGEALEKRLLDIRAAWPSLQRRLTDHVMRNKDMVQNLAAAGSVSNAADIGFGAGRLRATVHASRFIRDRYTILDFLAETGLLEDAVTTALSDEALTVQARLSREI